MPDFGPELRRWVLGLEPERAVMLMRSLLSAEASRTRAEPGSVIMTGNIYVPDGGVDGHTNLPPTAISPFPVGSRTWQVKAGDSRPSPSGEVSKWGVQEDLRAGRDYVLVWTGRELTALDKEAFEREFIAEVRKTEAIRTAVVLSVLDVEAMAVLHPAVVQQQGGPRLFGLSHDQWERHFDLPFFADDARGRLLDQAREFASSDCATLTHLHFFGDTGVGKSRLVFEALRQEGLKERTVVAPRLDAVDSSRLSEIVSNDNASVILCVDDCTWSDAKALETYASAGQGRIRLLTIGDRLGRDVRADASTPAGVRDLHGCQAACRR